MGLPSATMHAARVDWQAKIRNQKKGAGRPELADLRPMLCALNLCGFSIHWPLFNQDICETLCVDHMPILYVCIMSEAI